jgi:hypothetical protein
MWKYIQGVESRALERMDLFGSERDEVIRG